MISMENDSLLIAYIYEEENKVGVVYNFST